MEEECVVPTPNRVGCAQEDDNDFNIKLPERIKEECYFKTKSRKIHKLVAASAGGGTCQKVGEFFDYINFNEVFVSNWVP